MENKFLNMKDAYDYFSKRIRHLNHNDARTYFFNALYAAQDIKNKEDTNEFYATYGIFPWYLENLYILFLLNNDPNSPFNKKRTTFDEFRNICHDVNETETFCLKSNYVPSNYFGLMISKQFGYRLHMPYLYYYYSYILNDKEVRPMFEREYGILPDEVISISLAIDSLKGEHLESFIPNIQELIYKLDGLIKFYGKKYEWFKLEQEKIYEKWNFDFIYCPILLEKYPVVLMPDGKPEIPLIRLLLTPAVEGYIKMFKDKNSDCIGKLNENFCYMLLNEYSYKTKELILRNPKSKTFELGDVIFESGGKLIIIDVKSKDINIDIHTEKLSNSSFKTINGLIEQRLKALIEIKKTKYKFYDKEFKMEDIYSIVLVKNCSFLQHREVVEHSRQFLIDNNYSKYLDYVKTNLKIMDFMEFTSYVLVNNDFLNQWINNNSIGNYFNNLNYYPGEEIDSSYSKWYKNICNKALDLIVDTLSEQEKEILIEERKIDNLIEKT